MSNQSLTSIAVAFAKLHNGTLSEALEAFRFLRHQGCEQRTHGLLPSGEMGRKVVFRFADYDDEMHGLSVWHKLSRPYEILPEYSNETGS